MSESGRPSVADTLGEYFAGASAAAIGPLALERAAMVVASTLASAAAGTTISSADIARRMARGNGGAPEASLWFDASPRLPVIAAAPANAWASDAAACDDSDLRNIVHAGTPASSVGLGVAEAEGSSGEELLIAVVLGCEAAGRLAAAITPGFRQRGFHGSIGAVFAAAVSAGRLLALNAEEMSEAIGLAATSIGGITIAADTSEAREYHAGAAATAGIRAAQAAKLGYRGERGVLDAPAGFFEAFGGVPGEVAAAAALFEGLGDSFDIVTDMAIKLMPGSHSFHSIAEAAALALAEGSIAPEEVEAITLSRPDMTALRGPRHPDDLVSMAHSSAYFAAAAIADGALGWQHATPEKIADPAIHRLIDLVAIGEAPAGEEASRYRQGSTVEVSARDGRVGRATVFAPRGLGERVAWEDLDAKFRALVPAAGVDERVIEATLGALHRLGEADGPAHLIEALRS